MLGPAKHPWPVCVHKRRIRTNSFGHGGLWKNKCKRQIVWVGSLLSVSFCATIVSTFRTPLPTCLTLVLTCHMFKQLGTRLYNSTTHSSNGFFRAPTCRMIALQRSKCFGADRDTRGAEMVKKNMEKTRGSGSVTVKMFLGSLEKIHATLNAAEILGEHGLRN